MYGVEQVATKLREAEREHTTSRRRVHELEAELEYVNQQANEEKSHIEEHRSFAGGSPDRRDLKGKRREYDVSLEVGSAAYWEQKYRATLTEKEGA